MTLGAILAGGRARRFGSDKGAALLGGAALVDHVAAALRSQVDALIIVGRDWPGIERIEDQPAPDLGPLGGLCAAMLYGAAQGHERVLSVGGDTLPVPADLSVVLDPAPCVVEGQWLFGLWPTALGRELEHWLITQDDRSIRGWMRRSGARSLPVVGEFYNINTPEDLVRLEQDFGGGLFPPKSAMLD